MSEIDAKLLELAWKLDGLGKSIVELGRGIGNAKGAALIDMGTDLQNQKTNILKWMEALDASNRD